MNAGKTLRSAFYGSALLTILLLSGCATQQPVSVSGWQGAAVTLKAMPAAARLVNQGNQQFAGGNFEQARSAYAAAMKEDPLSLLPWYQRGVMELRLSNYQNAIDAFDEVLRRDPNQQDALHYRGQAINLQAEALNDLKSSVQKAPRAASAAPSGTTPKPPATTKPATATPFEGLASGAPTTAPASKPPLIPPPSKAPPSRPAADASNPFGSL